MPDGGQHRTWLRLHRNGLIAGVVEIEADRFIAYAGRSEQTCLASSHASLVRAQAAADSEARLDGHACNAVCGSWSK